MSQQRIVEQLAGLRFQFLADHRGWRFDTIPFYLERLREFLFAHRGSCLWIQGSLQREAYLLFDPGIQHAVLTLLEQSLRQLQRVQVTPLAQPGAVLTQAIGEARPILGYLALADAACGSEPTPPTHPLPGERPVDLPPGFTLHGYTFTYGAAYASFRADWGEPAIRLVDATVTHAHNPQYRERQAERWFRRRDLATLITQDEATEVSA